MPEIRIDYSPHPGQMLFHNSQARFRILCCGRRWGKDRASINELIKKCAELSSLDRPSSLIPRVHAWIVAPTYNLTRQSWEELNRFVPKELVAKVNQADRIMRWHNDVVIEARSADRPGQLVSVGLDVLLATEAAQIKEDAWRVALRPCLASPGRGFPTEDGRTSGGMLIANSTPRGFNWYSEAFQYGQDPLMAGVWESWRFPSISNPYFNPLELEEARRNMPERLFEQEFEARFLDDAGGVFRNVKDCATGMFEAPVPGRRYVIGVDWGRHNDFTVAIVLDATVAGMPRVVAIMRMRETGYALQAARVRALREQYCAYRVLVESNGAGDAILEQLQKDMPGYVDGYFMSNASKRVIVEQLAVRFEQRSIILPDPDTCPDAEPLIKELQIFAYRMSESGNVKYSAPQGHHDDHVIALGLANHVAGVLIVPSGLTAGTRFNWGRVIEAQGLSAVAPRGERVDWSALRF